ncbi:hypothetical protein IFM89_029563 [Coptis chinensis]|uniref:Zinc finger PMZ-type domain-containing protein n=1 Tax=Coptis chinensis TaxID=261450 RepID=A0A835H1N0_9MAGN|nr:hypothetical protein IFM89_029563 [Coptis chinensis]
MIRDNPSMKPREIMRLIHREYHLDISYYYAYIGRELALKDIYGEDGLSYYQLCWFEDALKASNPSSHVVLEIDEGLHKFRRIFISFGAFDVARSFRVVRSNEFEFEVEDVIVHYVNVERRSCSRRYWQINDFPCVHEVASIISSGGLVYSFIDPAFTVSSFSQSYSHSIHPIANIEMPMEMPENCDIMPPDVRRGPERPKKKRIESTCRSKLETYSLEAIAID